MQTYDFRWRNYAEWLQFWLRSHELRLREADLHENIRCFARRHLYCAVRAARSGDINAMNTHLSTVKKYLGRPYP